MAHRGRLLKSDLDAAAGGVFDCLLGLVVKDVHAQAATGRSQGGDVWVRQERTRCTMEGSIAYMEMGNGLVCASARNAGLRKDALGKGTGMECACF